MFVIIHEGHRYPVPRELEAAGGEELQDWLDGKIEKTKHDAEARHARVKHNKNTTE